MIKNWVVAQKLTTKPVPQLVEYGETVVGMMTLSAYFNAPNPVPANPSLADVTTALGNLDAAFSATGGGVTHTDAINVAKEVVLNDLNLLGNYVQYTANQAVNKSIGDVVIHAAGMEYRRQGIPKARVFAVINSPAQQGNVIGRTVNAGARAAYEWQFKRVNEANFTAAQITVKASYTFTGLTAGTKYQFRVKSIDSKGNVNLSQVFELVVL